MSDLSAALPSGLSSVFARSVLAPSAPPVVAPAAPARPSSSAARPAAAPGAAAPTAARRRAVRLRRRPRWLDAAVFVAALLAGIATGVLLNPPG